MVFIKEALFWFGGILQKSLAAKASRLRKKKKKSAGLDGRREQKLQIREIVLSAYGMRDHFSL